MSHEPLNLEQITPDEISTMVDGAWNREQIRLIRQQVAPEATPAELALFLQVAHRVKLDPFRRQIYAIHRMDRRLGRKVMTIQTGIDGLRAIAERSRACAGISDATFGRSGNGGKPASATVTVYRFVGGERCAFTATARWEEYSQTYGLWPNKPHVMLAKCAEALALRKAFPGDMSGLYMADEMPGEDQPTQLVSSQTVRPELPPAVCPLEEDLPRPQAREGNGLGEGHGMGAPDVHDFELVLGGDA